MRGRLAAGLLTTTVLLAGCSGAAQQPDAGPVPSATTSPLTAPILRPPTASPTPSVAEEIENAVRDYYGAVSEAASTGDLSLLDQVSVPSCPCRSVLDFIRQTYADGNRFDRFGYRIESVGTPDVQGDRATVEVTYTQSPYKLVDGDGTELKSFPAVAPITVTVTLDRTDDGWKVAGIEGVSP